MAEDADAIQQLLDGIRSFSWDEAKRKANLGKHKLDFLDARRVFDQPVLVRQSDRNGQIRYQVFGTVEGRAIAVACRIKGKECRIISARAASRTERRHLNRLAGQSSPRQD